ncbi:DMT family transporter [Blastopirellula sp. JC732]|uniref:DMT family transporter n=1 Tax=Blastopirellula sediminis TaxID=2894196 RepID=A0A9X1MIN1_9BACT|nr:EamA family transporter [Blastopirellula sediminis]MCC9607736.1 DMT family transporter [Blastopirellula sediminis]MCC9627471.1 DMT family transporter [Blastopirellula sediminis]
MRPSDTIKLTILASIWGASFLLMRIMAPALGPFGLASSRLLIAGIILSIWFTSRGLEIEWRRNWRQYTVIGLLNAAIPFTMFGVAALYIPAGYSAVINATTPIFGVVWSAFIFQDRPTPMMIVGAILGLIGVGVIAGLGPVETSWALLASIGACLTAAICYSAAGVYIKTHTGRLKPMGVASAAQLIGGAVLIPGLAFYPPKPELFTPTVIAATITLALLCSAIGFVLYYQLLADCGPTKALTVTYIVPVFGVLWGALFLGETITPVMIGGMALVIGGTFLLVRRH